MPLKQYRTSLNCFRIALNQLRTALNCFRLTLKHSSMTLKQCSTALNCFRGALNCFRTALKMVRMMLLGGVLGLEGFCLMLEVGGLFSQRPKGFCHRGTEVFFSQRRKEAKGFLFLSCRGMRHLRELD